MYITACRSKNSTSYSLDVSLKSGERVKLLGNEAHPRLLFVEQEIEGYYGIFPVPGDTRGGRGVGLTCSNSIRGQPGITQQVSSPAD